MQRSTAEKGDGKYILYIRRLCNIHACKGWGRAAHEREMKFENVIENNPIKRYEMCEQTHKHTNIHVHVPTYRQTYRHSNNTDERGSLKLTPISLVGLVFFQYVHVDWRKTSQQFEIKVMALTNNNNLVFKPELCFYKVIIIAMWHMVGGWTSKENLWGGSRM